jgi:lysophospholipase L1-like esterase
VLTGLLNKALPDRKLEIINMGVPGYSSLQGLTLVEEEVLDLDPDLVIAGYGFNDTWHMPRSDAANLERARSLAGGIVSLLIRIRLVYWGGHLIKSCFSGKEGGKARAGLENLSKEEIEALKKRLVRRVSPEEHGANIGALCDRLRSRGISVLLLDMFCQGAWHSAMRKAAGERNVPVIDGEGHLEGVLERALEGDPALEELRQWAEEKYTALALEKDPRLHIFNDNCHANPAGYRLLARLVADEVIKRCLK